MRWLLVCLLLLAAVLTACAEEQTETPPATVVEPTRTGTQGLVPGATDTPPLPTATPEAVAAQVDEAVITRADYQSELARYQAALGRELTSEDSQFVLNDMISMLLLAQGAGENGFVVTEGMVQERLEYLVGEAGGESVFQAWLDANFYTLEGFRAALGRTMAAAWMRDQITTAVADVAEQVQLSQILVDSQQEADSIVSRLQVGADFESIAFEYEPVTKGYLGWAPRGFLLEPAVEEAAFTLDVGQFSQVIATDIGYHIVYVMSREPEHPLAPEARLTLQEAALQDWLDARWEQADIQLFTN
jgi:parvulin-like peptidyl-prolyl isomerase